MTAVVNLALKRLDHRLMDVHYEIQIALEKPTPPAGAPTKKGSCEMQGDGVVLQIGNPNAV